MTQKNTTTRDSFIFYRSFYESIKELPKEQQSEILIAIFELSLNNNEVELSGISKAMFTLMKPQIEANYKRYQNGSKSKAKSKQKISKSEANKNENNNTNDNKKEIKEKINFDDINDIDTLFEFWCNNKNGSKYKNKASKEIAKKKLLKLGDDDFKTCKLIVENSIANGYQGLFELKTNKNSDIVDKDGMPW